jgi:hypothetical protein
VHEAEESTMLEAVAREQLVKIQQAGKRLMGAMEISGGPINAHCLHIFNLPHKTYIQLLVTQEFKTYYLILMQSINLDQFQLTALALM